MYFGNPRQRRQKLDRKNSKCTIFTDVVIRSLFPSIDLKDCVGITYFNLILSEQKDNGLVVLEFIIVNTEIVKTIELDKRC